MIRRYALLFAALLSACGGLDTSYGTHSGASINGMRVLHDALAARTTLRDAWLLSPSLDDADLLFYAATGPELPDAQASDWLLDWLEAGETPRQVVILVRDGNVTAALCQRWAAEARLAGQSEAAARFAKRAAVEGGDHVDVPAVPSETDLFVMATRETAPVRTLAGLGLSEAPTTLTLGAFIDPEEDGAVLVTADDLPFVVAWPIGENGQLLAIANATGLVDGALPDPRARRLLDALLQEIGQFHGASQPKAVWLGSLRVREAEPEDLNMLSFLHRSPFAWPLWHLLVLLVVAVLARAAWLGRREATRDRTTARFSRHVDALAGHMAKAAAKDPSVVRDAAAAWTATVGRPMPPATLPSATDAVAWLNAPPAPPPSAPPPGEPHE